MITYLCLLLTTVAITNGRQIECYNCSSEEWHVSDICEFPSNKTPTVICRMACQTLYLRGNTYLLRGCVRRKTDLDVLDEQFCYEDNCNDDIKWEKINVDNTNHYGGREKSCFRCLSTKSNPDPTCETVDNQTRRSKHCDRKRCTVFHKSISREIKRDCYAWSKLSKYIMKLPGDDWTIDWCDTEDCNDERISEYPGCKGGHFDYTKTDPDWGCISSFHDTTFATVTVYENCSTTNSSETSTSTATEETTTHQEETTTHQEETVRIPVVCAANTPAFKPVLILLCNALLLLWLHKINKAT